MITNDKFNVVHPIAAGLDVHKMQITASIRHASTEGDEGNLETREFTALPSGLTELTDWLQEKQVDAALMEGTGIYWIPPFEALEAKGIKALLVHAHKVKQLKGRKTDTADSAWLARVCQFGLTTWSFVPPKTFREARVLSRHRRKLINTRNGVANRVHKMLDANGIQIGGILSDIFGLNGRRILEGLRQGKTQQEILGSLTGHVERKREAISDALDKSLSPASQFVLDHLLTEYDELNKHIDSVAKLTRETLGPWSKSMLLLQTIPGIDAQSATDIMSEVGPDLDVFGHPDRFTAWAGVCPGNNESAGKHRPGGARRGSSHLRTILTSCAHAAARTKDTQFQGKHRQLTARRGYKRAILATAHQLAKVIWAVLRDQEPYYDPGIDYTALMVHRNAPRWIQMLAEYHYIYPAKESQDAKN